MITLSKIRELDLAAATGPGQCLHLSAASGLVCAGSYCYVVADDELHLGVFRSPGAQPGELIRLFPGELPAAKEQRKAHKPDLETLLRLPSFAGHRHGALLALGSGSTVNRRQGALLALDAHGAASGAVRVVDLTDMFAALDEDFTSLNIEGGIVSGDELRLLQRGNNNAGNALIRFYLPSLLDGLVSRAGIARMVPFAVHANIPASLFSATLSLA